MGERRVQLDEQKSAAWHAVLNLIRRCVPDRTHREDKGLWEEETRIDRESL